MGARTNLLATSRSCAIPQAPVVLKSGTFRAAVLAPKMGGARTAVVACATPSLFPVSLFPSSNVLLPSGTGALHVYEPRFLQMFAELRDKAGGSASGVRFGHMMSPSAAPPALLESSVGGYPRVGVLAGVTAIHTRPDGTLLVEYEGLRRISLLSIWQHQPYMVAAACVLQDEQVPNQAEMADELEQQLYRTLLEVARLTRLLEQGDSPPKLPESIARYSPPPPSAKRQSVAEYLQGSAAYSSAGHMIAMWQMQHAKSKPDKVQSDPYQVVSEELAKDTRQELFSFAAASMLELGQAERLALLTSRDLAARLHWVLAAIEPYLLEQRARASVAKALGGST